MSRVTTRALLGLVAALCVATTVQAQTVILTRHAERADSSADSDLSQAGRLRAETLAERLDDAGVTHVFVTPFQRTRLTAAPTAQAAGVAVRAFDVSDGLRRHVESLVQAIREAGPDAVVLVVGHSNTVPEIARALGDAAAEPIPECAYDRLVTIRLEDMAAQVVRERYGAASAC